MAQVDARTREFNAPRARHPGCGSLWLAPQLVSPFIFAAFFVLAVWGGYRPELNQADDVFRHVIVCVTVALAYLAVQAFAVVLQPVGSDVRPLLDVLTSLAPAVVIAFAMERWLSGYLQLDFYQLGVLWVASLAVLLDLVCFTLFAMKVNRLAPDVVVTSSAMRTIVICLALALVGVAGSARANEPVGDAKRGRVSSEQLCAECHAIKPGDLDSPRSDVASFTVIANSPGMSELALSVWLSTPHREMPHIVLEADERAAIVAYITSLRLP